MSVDRREVAAVFVGGFLGAVARADLGERLATEPGAWPWSTLIVNVVGAFVLGYAVTRLGERLPQSAYRRPFVGTGLCGGLTTFSAMQVEVLAMLDDGEALLAAAYLTTSVTVGFAAVLLATNLVRRARLTA